MRARRVQSGRRGPAGRGRCSPAAAAVDEDAQRRRPARRVSGETETGMKLKVDTFVAPANDPTLKKLDAWRSAEPLPGGRLPPRHRRQHRRAGRRQRADAPLRDGRRRDRRGQGRSRRASAATRSQFEWVPPQGHGHERMERAAQTSLRGRPAEAGRHRARRRSRSTTWSPTAASAERGIRTMKVFGPRDAEFK